MQNICLIVVALASLLSGPTLAQEPDAPRRNEGPAEASPPTAEDRLEESLPEESAPTAPNAESPAPTEPAEPREEAPQEPPREPQVGDVVGGWTLVAFRGEKRLPDGRPTLESCGYVADVVVEKGPRVEKAMLQVPCQRAQSGLVPGEARLSFPEPATSTVEPPASPESLGVDGDGGQGESATTDSETSDAASEGSAGAATLDDTGSGPPPSDEKGPDEKTPDEKTPAEAAVPGKPFLKGELTQLGTVQLVNARTSFGVALGASGVDGVYYVVARPELNLHFAPFELGLAAPLRFQVLDTNRFTNALDPGSYSAIFDGAGAFRQEDWDQIEDWLRPLRYLSWGRKEDHLYLDVNRVRALTIGHGQLLRRYSPNVDIDEDNLFAEVDAYADFGGVELIAGPFPIPRVVGGLVFVKPLGLFLDDYISKSLSLGFTYLTDLNAPTSLAKVRSSGGSTQLPVDDSGELLFSNQGRLVGDRVQGIGVDGEIKLVKWEFIDLKAYADYSHLLLPGVPEDGIAPFSDGGFTVGALLRMSFGEKPLRKLDDEPEQVRLGKAPREMQAAHALRLRLEGRVFGPQYLPSYWNTLYEVDKQQFGFGDIPVDERATLPTKIQWLASQEGEPWRVGHYLELSYVWVDLIGLTALYEDAWTVSGFNGVAAARNIALHAETFGLGWLQLFATYHYRHFADFSKMFQLTTDNEVLYLGGRLALLPILYINLGVQRAFRTGFSPFDDPKAKSPLPGKPDVSPAYRYTSVGLENAWTGTLDIELGWQF